MVQHGTSEPLPSLEKVLIKMSISARSRYSNRAVVLYHIRILYRTRMVHTISIYAYGTCDHMRMIHTIQVWYSNPYHMSIT